MRQEKTGETRKTPFEPRWPVVLAILAVLLLLAELPDRILLFPVWVPYFLGLVVLTPIAMVSLVATKTLWSRVERICTLLFCLIGGVGTFVNLGNLIGAMLHHSREIDGLQLLTSSVAVWATNVLVFSLLYWQIDRGGPAAREDQTSPHPDWLFPQEGAPVEDLPQGWRPMFVDYLFLGFCTATAFSPTDALPLTPRAKMLMMLESTISLATIVVVASRAINILGS
jgi:hypothetical protein